MVDQWLKMCLNGESIKAKKKQDSDDDTQVIAKIKIFCHGHSILEFYKDDGGQSTEKLFSDEEMLKI